MPGSIEPQFAADCLDGRLTSLDQLAARDSKAEAIVRTRTRERGRLTESVVRALASYPLRPVGWLVGVDFDPPDQSSIDLLARALREAIGDGHRGEVIKCLRIWSNVQAGTFSSNAATIDLLRTYPGDPSKPRQADSAIRAIWGAHRGMLVDENAHHITESIKWARLFWGANSMTTRCVRQRDEDSNEAIDDTHPAFPAHDETPAPSKVPTDGANLRQLAMDLLSS